ncbi:hypothetical protein OG381_34355 [Streptomyces sp. NBC_00490]|uniref:hypothetical protein n=1 Tax=Streptomyces sp. NBC_00490 TaxID=2903657 RepID=UPI002E19B1B7
MANAYNYSNTAIQTTLSGNISGAATSVTVAATTGFPGTTPYVLALDYGASAEELVVVTGVAGTTLTVTRGFSGTSAQSHSIGAVVRHVYNAQDAVDFRTHEDATASVHGVTGALVGATQTQTLTNKTLTSPTVNGGALSGTFTGAPTFSGAVTLSGAAVLSGTPSISSGAALAGMFTGNPTLSGNVNFTGAPTFLTSAGVLFQRGADTNLALRASVTGDAQNRVEILAGGGLQWGSGAAAVDTNLYRSAANVLATDDAFSVGADLSVGTTTWTPFTPTWTITGSPATTTNVGWYKKLGKIVFFEIYTVWSASGSGAVNIQGNLPSTPFREGNGAASTRQFVSGFITGTNVISPGMVMGQILAGGAGTAMAVNMYDNQGMQSGYIQSGTIITLQGWYREA